MEVEGGANECGIWIVFDVVDGSRRYGIDVTSDSCLLLLIMPQFTCLVVILMLSRPMLSFQYVSGLHVALSNPVPETPSVLLSESQWHEFTQSYFFETVNS